MKYLIKLAVGLKHAHSALSYAVMIGAVCAAMYNHYRERKKDGKVG